MTQVSASYFSVDSEAEWRCNIVAPCQLRLLNIIAFDAEPGAGLTSLRIALQEQLATRGVGLRAELFASGMTFAEFAAFMPQGHSEITLQPLPLELLQKPKLFRHPEHGPLTRFPLCERGEQIDFKTKGGKAKWALLCVHAPYEKEGTERI